MKYLFTIILSILILISCDKSNKKSFSEITYYDKVMGSAIQLQIEDSGIMKLYNYNYFEGEYSYRGLLEKNLFEKLSFCVDSMELDKLQNTSFVDDVLDGGSIRLIIDFKDNTSLELDCLEVGSISLKYKELIVLLEKSLVHRSTEKDTLILNEFKHDLIRTHKNFYDESNSKSLASLVQSLEEASERESEDIFYNAVEEMPHPIGGIGAIQSKILYPESKKDYGIQGRVIAYAYVNENGKVVKVEVVKGLGKEFDILVKQAIKKTMFTIGKQRGRPVKVKTIVPVVFKK